MLQQNVYLRVNRRQFKGDRCQKPFGEELNFVKKTRTYIEEVSIDLWSASKNLVQDLMPNAEVVADRFHVMKLVNEELDAKEKLLKEKEKSSKIDPNVDEFLKESKRVNILC